MIQLIVHLFSTISNGFYYLFWTSYSIGKLISWIFCSALNILSFIWYNVREAGTIFSEDFLIFLKDLIGVAANVLDVGKDSILTSCAFFYSIVRATCTTITELFTTGNIHTINVGQQCIHSFAAMMNSLRNLFVLIGNGTWFILTLVPTVLLSILTYVYQISQIWLEIGLSFSEAAWISMKEVTSASVNYFLDVPLQAIIGCSFIVLLVIYRRVTLTFMTWLTIRILQYLQSRLLTACLAVLSTFRGRNNNNRSRLVQPTYPRASLLSTVCPRLSTQNTKPNTTTDENVCVICRDEQKNVVLMPCRHLCLCITCSGSIHTCPLCRKPIRNILSVYT